MTYRVVQWATGTVGIHAAPAIARHRDLELVGLWAHSEAKVGRDVGDICGTETLGVTATDDRDALLDLRPDAICYTASSDIRPDGVIDDICDFLAAGINVVNTSYVPLLFPRAAGVGVEDRIEAACREGGTTFFTSGIDPGYGNAGLAIETLSLCEEVRSVRMMEIVNYATWDQAFTMFEIMGFGKTDPSESLLLSPGSLSLAWGPVVHLVADAIGWQLDEVTESFELIHAPEPIEIASGTIDTGGISGMRFEISGMVDGRPAVIVEHVTRTRDHDAPHWPQGQGYRVVIDGEPSAKVELELSSTRGDHNTAGCLATAMAVVNALPTVCEAAPGILTLASIDRYSAAVR